MSRNRPGRRSAALVGGAVAGDVAGHPDVVDGDVDLGDPQAHHAADGLGHVVLDLGGDVHHHVAVLDHDGDGDRDLAVHDLGADALVGAARADADPLTDRLDGAGEVAAQVGDTGDLQGGERGDLLDHLVGDLYAALHHGRGRVREAGGGCER